jgi:predicted nuclease of predicted toxin-antitoxin system
VKLLFDQNISPRLPRTLALLYPGSGHVRQFGLQHADDEIVWNFAREHGYTIVSKDSDFRQRSFLFGAPPKVVWIRMGNCTTSDIERILKERHPDIRQFCADMASAFLILS